MKSIQSHAYIIASQNAEARGRKANSLAQTLVCDSGGDTPCGSCGQCRRALRGVHPDIIFIERLSDKEGKLKRELVVEQIRDMRADALLLPQQASHKVYIIPEAGLMNESAQNAALIILEEPPEYAVFILCADNSEEFLPTVRSRCVILRGGEKEVGADNTEARDFISTALSGDEAELLRLCSKHEKMDGASCTEFIDACRSSLVEKICINAAGGISVSEERALLAVFERAAEYLRSYVSAKHVFGYISVSAI